MIENTALSFDQYQRYSLAAEIINLLHQSRPCRIIETGANYHSIIAHFLPDAELVLLDQTVPDGIKLPPNFVLGDATNLEFPDSSFDFSISLDVLEHVNPELRGRFLEEHFRVSRNGVIVACPIGCDETRAAELEANDAWKTHFGKGHIWLDEHARYGLPTIHGILESVAKITPHVFSFNHGSLNYWLPLMKLHFHKEAHKELAVGVSEFDRFYNRFVSSSDFGTPSYRQFVVMLRSQEDVQKLEKHFSARLNHSPESGDYYGSLFHAWAASVEGISASHAALNQAVIERDGRIAHLKLVELNRDALLASTSWRLTAPLRIVGKQLERAAHIWRLLPRILTIGGGLRGSLIKALRVLRDEGLFGVKQRIRYVAIGRPPLLHSWIRRYDTLTDASRATIKQIIAKLAIKPVISVVMPVYNPRPEWLQEAIESVRSQLYPHWELCMADDASTDLRVRELLEQYAREDTRIRIVFRENNGHISAASNSALALATGEYIALLDHDDVLAEHAFYWVADAINRHPDAGLIYSDEDKIDEHGSRHDPYFKCDWNHDLFLSHNLVTHLGVYRTSLVRSLEGCREGFEGAQDYDLALRCIERLRADQIIHIPRILYHWRSHKGSTAQDAVSKPYAVLAGARAINEHFQRLKIRATAEALPQGHYRVRYALPSPPPLVTLIIPTRNGLALLRRCVSSVLEKTDYPNYEVLIVDNGSDDRDVLEFLDRVVADRRAQVRRDDRPFNFSALNNRAVEVARGELVGLINNDIEVVNRSWLTEMVGIALQPGVGAVGARLWYPDNTLQHGGIVLGVGGVAGHSHRRLPRGADGYFNRANLIQSLSAVTAACMIIRKRIYLEAGGLDEKHLAVAFNDVDFCLKVRELGYRNVWTPYAELYHHESATRGYEDSPEKRGRFATEVAYMKQRWGTILRNDPAYSPNLTLDREDFSIAWPSRLEQKSSR